MPSDPSALDPCAVPHSLMSVDQHVLAQARRSVAISRLVRSHSPAVQPEMDRSVRKILSLPLFGDDFCQWLVDLRMAQFEKLCAVSDGTIDECVQAFVNLVPARGSILPSAAED